MAAELGTLSAIISIATFGAQTSMILYDLASTIGSEKREVIVVARNIAGFCSVLQHLGSTLEKARSARFSISAVSTTQDVLDRYQELFEEISDIATKLQKPQNVADPKQVSMSHVARVKWVFKRVKVQRIQAELESMKMTLLLMLTTMDFVQRIASRKESGIDHNLQTKTEDEEAHAVAASLIVAQQSADGEVESLEIEMLQDEEDEEPLDVDASPLSSNKKQRGHSYRASVLIFGGNAVGSVHNMQSSNRPLTWTGSHSNMDTRQLFVNLLRRWANCETSLQRFQGTNSEGKKDPPVMQQVVAAKIPSIDILKGSVMDIIEGTLAEASLPNASGETSVDLSGRHLTTFRRSLSTMDIRLALSRNKLTNFGFRNNWNFNSLRYLNLRSNYFEIFPLPVTNMMALEILDISKNKITTLPADMIKLQELIVPPSITDNALAAPPLVLGRLEKLRVIHAETNPFLEFGEYAGIYIGLEEKEDDPRAVDGIVSERLKKLLQGKMLPVAGISGKMAPWRRGMGVVANRAEENGTRPRPAVTNAPDFSQLWGVDEYDPQQQDERRRGEFSRGDDEDLVDLSDFVE